MEKVKFTCSGYVGDNLDADYVCDKPDDQSGEYVRVEVAEELLATLKKIVAPGGRENVMQIAVPVIEKYDSSESLIVNDTSDICGLCGQPGADKIPSPVHWPGERIPDTELVHAECEDEECKRAHSCLTPKQRQATLDGISGRYY